MFKKRRMEFSTKILEFAIKIGGRAGQKIRKLMISEEYANSLIAKNKRNKNTIPKTEPKNWTDMDPK